MVANILPTDTPSTQGVGSKGQTIYFSESSHVAYQIKADDTGSNMVANILPTDTPLTQGGGGDINSSNLPCFKANVCGSFSSIQPFSHFCLITW